MAVLWSWLFFTYREVGIPHSESLLSQLPKCKQWLRWICYLIKEEYILISVRILRPPPGGVVHKVLYGDWWRLRSEVQSLTFQYTIFERKSTPFLYFLFRIPSLRPGILLTAVTDAYQWLRTSLNLKGRLRQLRNGLYSYKEGHRILSTVIS